MGWVGPWKALPPPPDDTTATAEATEAWTDVMAWAQTQLNPAALGWLNRLSCVGEIDSAIVVGGSSEVVSWVRRRHGKLLGDAVRSQTTYTGLHIGLVDEHPVPEEVTF